MTIRHKTWAVAAALLLFTMPALARDDDGDGGPYLALNVGQSIIFDDCAPPGMPSSCAMNRKTHAYFGTFGYQYTPMLALEASYGKVGYLSSYMVMPLGLSVQAVATVDMGDIFSVFAKAGATYMSLRNDGVPSAAFRSNGTSLTGGVGIRIPVNAKLSFVVQGDYFGSYTIFEGMPQARLMAATIGLMQRY